MEKKKFALALLCFVLALPCVFAGLAYPYSIISFTPVYVLLFFMVNWGITLGILYYAQKWNPNSLFAGISVKKFFYGSAAVAVVSYFFDLLVFLPAFTSPAYWFQPYFLLLALAPFFAIDFVLLKFVFKAKAANAAVLAAALWLSTSPIATFLISFSSENVIFILLALFILSIIFFVAVFKSLAKERPAADKPVIKKFKLAVFGLFLLGFILGMAIPYSPPGGHYNDVQQVARQIIQMQVDLPGQFDTSTMLTFKSGTTLASSALVGNSSLAPEQICLHKGDFDGNPALAVHGNAITNNGANDLTLKISVMCHKANALQEALADIGFVIDLAGESAICQCDLAANQKCCVIILRSA